MENRPLYSAEISDIIGTPPRWIMRAGSGLLLLLLVAGGGIAGSVSLPELQTVPVLIRSTAPVYALTAATHGRWLVKPGTQVRAGQPLTRLRQDSTRNALAPFAGTVYYEPARPAGASDTLGVLIPATTTYQFSGKIELRHLAALRQSPELRLQVTAGTVADEDYTLRGYLRSVHPVAYHGVVSYVGELDAASGRWLSRQTACINSLPGQLVWTRTPTPVLQRLFH